MRVILRYFTFSLISVYFTQMVLEGFKLGRGIFFVIMAITLLNLFSYPVVKVISLPSRGIGYFFINVFLTFTTIFALTIFMPFIQIQTTFTANLINPYIVIPFKSFNPVLTTILSAFSIGFVFNFLMWVSSKK